MNATPTETPTYDGPGPQRPTRDAELAHSAEESATSELTRLLAQTPSLLPRVERLALLAEHDVPILLTGETGTGKTSLARLLHDCSPRRNEPFVTVPCGALPPLLVESEFFGHVRGAFTGAERDREGKLTAAGRGTFLLDEIDTLSLEQQAKLLRVLDSGEYEPVGGNDTLRRSCRIAAASNADLGELARQGMFRADLYFRLHVLPFHLPPLRERVQDIEPLARGFISRYTAQLGREAFDIGPEALAALEAYPWPGNIRELDNVMRQATLLSRGTVLLSRHLPDWVRKGAAESTLPGTAPRRPLGSEREAAEKGLIRRVLADHSQSRTRAARELGISRVTLYQKMKKYGLARA
jgi:transcriptional regulator with PAS, ATPase and Fis domain